MPELKYRPPAPLVHANTKDHLRQIAQRANVGLPIDATHPMVAPLILADYTVATLPTASEYTNGMIIVSDETGGLTMAISDGTNWRRMQDRAVVS